MQCILSASYKDQTALSATNYYIILIHLHSTPLPFFCTVLSSEQVFADFSNPNRRWFAMTDGLLGARFPIGGQRNQSSDLLN